MAKHHKDSEITSFLIRICFVPASVAYMSWIGFSLSACFLRGNSKRGRGDTCTTSWMGRKVDRPAVGLPKQGHLRRD